MNNKKAKKIRKIIKKYIEQGLVHKNNILEGGTLRADNKLSPIRYSKDSPRRVYGNLKVIF